jgi:hypothetical protein
LSNSDRGKNNSFTCHVSLALNHNRMFLAFHDSTRSKPIQQLLKRSIHQITMGTLHQRATIPLSSRLQSLWLTHICASQRTAGSSGICQKMGEPLLVRRLHRALFPSRSPVYVLHKELQDHPGSARKFDESFSSDISPIQQHNDMAVPNR